jgi:hypothetical protein
MKPTKPEDLFRAEKERALTVRNSQHARLLAEAKAAFDKLMAEGQAARKSGRPRKHPLPPLKTSPSTARPPIKPPAPAPVAKTAAPAVAKPAPPAPRPSTQATARGTAKRAKPARKAVRSSPRPKAKAKSSKKR